MKKKTKKVLATVLILITVITITISLSIYNLFFSIWWIKGQETLKAVSSPDNRYTVTAYLNNGGATVDYAVLGTVKDNKTGLKRNIYWQYHCYNAEIKWIDETTVIINDIELNIKEDTYDYRNK